MVYLSISLYTLSLSHSYSNAVAVVSVIPTHLRTDACVTLGMQALIVVVRSHLGLSVSLSLARIHTLNVCPLSLVLLRARLVMPSEQVVRVEVVCQRTEERTVLAFKHFGVCVCVCVFVGHSFHFSRM